MTLQWSARKKFQNLNGIRWIVWQMDSGGRSLSEVEESPSQFHWRRSIMRRTLRLSEDCRLGGVGHFLEIEVRHCLQGVRQKGMWGCLCPVPRRLLLPLDYIAAFEPWAVAGRTFYYVSLESTRLASLIATSRRNTNDHHQSVTIA